MEPGNVHMSKFLVSLGTTALQHVSLDSVIHVCVLTKRFPNDLMKVAFYIKGRQTFSTKDKIIHSLDFEAMWPLLQPFTSATVV